jgi:hypothetical protein
VPTSRDSVLYMFGEQDAPYNRAIGHQQLGLFKIGTNDSLWEYRAVTEFDSSRSVAVRTQLGELSVDDGLNVQFVDLNNPDDMLSIDSTHPAAYFMSSEPFTLPTTGSVSYYLKAGSANDSLYRRHLDTLKYVLEFADTSGGMHKLDSLILCDSVPHLKGSLRTVTLHQSAARRGHLQFRRVTPKLLKAGAQWQDIITDTKLSSDTSYKRGQGLHAEDDLLLRAIPNPMRDQTAILFTLPMAGSVSLAVFDELGREVTQIAETRMFHAGSHTLYWSSLGLPSGIYVAVLRYGNSVKTLHLSVLK